MAERPAGCARGSARIAPSAQGSAVGATGQRPRTLRARGAQGGAAGGVLSWGYPSLDKQRRVSGPQGCGTNPYGRESVLASAQRRLPRPTFGASRKAQPQGCGRTGTDASRFSTSRTRQTHDQGARRVPDRRDAGRTGMDASRFSTSRTRQTRDQGARRVPDRRDAGRTGTDASRFSTSRTRQTHDQGARRVRDRRDAGRTHTDVSRFSRSRTRSGQHKTSARAESPTAGMRDEHARSRVGSRAANQDKAIPTVLRMPPRRAAVRSATCFRRPLAPVRMCGSNDRRR